MLNYDNTFIKRSLDIFGFDDSLNVDMIEYVPMEEFRLATTQKPMLFVDNLQVCVSIFAYAENFGFAAHIRTVPPNNSDYEIDSNQQYIKCKRIDDLYNAIINSNLSAVTIGISIGCVPLDKSEKTIELVYNGIDQLKEELQSQGVYVNLLADQHEMNFILDARFGEIITPTRNKEKSRK